MSESKDLKDIPQMTQTFQIEVVGRLTKKRYVGDFTAKIPTIKDNCLIDKHQAFLNGDMAAFLDVGTLGMHERIATLRYVLTEYPKFWLESDLGYGLLDDNVVTEVYDKVIAFQTEWYQSIWGKQDGIEKA